MTEPELARVDTLADMIAAFVARKNSLNITDGEVDFQAGLAAGHWSKIATGERGIGSKTIEPLMDVLGVSFIMVEDPKKMARLTKLEKRRSSHVRDTHKVGRHTLRRVMQEMNRKSTAILGHGGHVRNGRLGGISRAASLTSEERSAIAKKAVEARWAKRRAMRDKMAKRRLAGTRKAAAA